MNIVASCVRLRHRSETVGAWYYHPASSPIGHRQYSLPLQCYNGNPACFGKLRSMLSCLVCHLRACGDQWCEPWPQPPIYQPSRVNARDAENARRLEVDKGAVAVTTYIARTAPAACMSRRRSFATLLLLTLWSGHSTVLGHIEITDRDQEQNWRARKGRLLSEWQIGIELTIPSTRSTLPTSTCTMRTTRM